MELDKQTAPEDVSALFEQAMKEVGPVSETEVDETEEVVENTEEVEENSEETQVEEPKEETETPAEQELTQEQKEAKAVETISKKLQEANRKSKERDSEIEALKAKLAKFEKEEVENTESTMSEEAKAELEKIKSESEATKAELNKLRLADGVKQLVSLGGDEKSIIKFLEQSKDLTGIDFRINPNSELMVKHYKAQNADLLIEAEVQRRLSAKKEASVEVKKTVVQSQPKKDEFLEEMLNFAKNSKH